MRTSPVDRRRPLALAGEELVARHLVASGMSLLARNWRCRLGELDLVVLDGGVLVAVEVKTRRSLAFGDPLEAITHTKVRRLRQLAAQFARDQELGVRGVRVDAVAVTWPPGEPPTLRHVKALGS